MTDTAQPLDALMTKLGLSNADLVNASTDQLSFKNVQKGRAGKRVTPNIQDKIMTALVAARPGLEVRRRDLFRYPANEVMIGAIENALELAAGRKITYPEFVDLLLEGGIVAYVAEPGPNRVTFHGFEGEVHVVQGAEASEGKPGLYNEAQIKSAIADAQKKKIDHPTFLRRIHEAGIGVYEVNTRKRVIKYKAENATYKERIPEVAPPAASEASAAKPSPASASAPDAKPVLSNKKKKALARAKKAKRPGIVRTTRKKRMTINKLYRAKKKKARRPQRKRVRQK